MPYISKDRVKNSPHIKYSVDLAVEILKEEGYEYFHTRNKGSLCHVFRKSHDSGFSENVMVFRGYMNGTMIFNNNQGKAETVMAWDYVRQMRPTPFQKKLDQVKAFLNLEPK